MIPIRHNFVRILILVIGLALLCTLFFFPLPVGAWMGLSFLLVLTGMAFIVPPGIYGWLIHATCPDCDGAVVWSAVNPEGEPYNEQIVRRCECEDKAVVEWSYRT